MIGPISEPVVTSVDVPEEKQVVGWPDRVQLLDPLSSRMSAGPTW